MDRYLLAHDLGTSGNKATLYREDGTLISSVMIPYETHYFHDNWAEQDPEAWWQAVCGSTRLMLQQSRIDPVKIAAVSFSGHMLGCLCLDKQGNPLRPHILWADMRAQKQAADLQQKIPLERFYRITGHRNSASYGLQKLMWVKDNEPEIYEQTAAVVNAKDWLVFRMTGVLFSEYSDASSMSALDLNSLKWSDEIITAAGIDGAKLPHLVKSTHVAGGVHAAAARATGLAVDTPVVMGGGDGLCATVGAGCVREGTAHACIGSSAWISFASEKPIFDDQMRTFNWVHMVPGMICPCGTMQTAGNAYSWLKNELAGLEVAQARQQNLSPYQLIDEVISQSVPGSNGLVFLPYLIGERAPRWNPDAKGAWIGLKMENKKADLFRSVLEGVTMNLAIIADVYREHGYALENINVIGGGAKGDIWCQMMADIWQSKIHRLNYLDEATSMGAAVAGGVGVGLYKDFTAIDQYIEIARTFSPDQQTGRIYQPLRRIFDQCYDALSPIFPQLNAPV